MNPIFKITRDELAKIRNEGLAFKKPLEEIEKEMAVKVFERREALVTAWIAETGLLPSESVICSGFQGNVHRIFVESKTENDKRAKAPGLGEEHL